MAWKAQGKQTHKEKAWGGGEIEIVVSAPKKKNISWPLRGSPADPPAGSSRNQSWGTIEARKLGPIVKENNKGDTDRLGQLHLAHNENKIAGFRLSALFLNFFWA